MELQFAVIMYVCECLRSIKASSFYSSFCSKVNVVVGTLVLRPIHILLAVLLLRRRLCGKKSVVVATVPNVAAVKLYTQNYLQNRTTRIWLLGLSEINS